MKEPKEDVIFQAYNSSSEKNQSFMVIYILMLLYVFVSITNTGDIDLLFVDGKLNLPIIDTPVPVVSFYIIVPAIILVGHYILLLNIFAHIEIAKEWRRIDKRMTVILPFIINHLLFSMRMDAIRNTRRIRFIVSLICIMAPALTLVAIQVRFADYHSMAVTTFHFLIVSMDVYLIIEFFKKTNPLFNEAWKVVGVFFLFSSAINIFITGLSILNPRILVGYENYFFVPKIIVTEYDATFSGGEKNSTKLKHPGVNLSNRNLQFANIIGINIDKARLSNTDLSYALVRDSSAMSSHIKESIFDHAKLDNVDLSKSTIENSSAQNATFQKTNLSNVFMTNVNLAGSTLKHATINEAYFSASDLSLTDLSDMLIYGASFYNTKALGINLSHVEMKGVIFNNVDARGSTLLSASLKGSNITSSDFRYSNLNKISALASVLSHNSFQGIQILGADISYSFLYKNDMYGAIIYNNKCLFYLNGFKSSRRNDINTKAEITNLASVVNEVNQIQTNLDTKVTAINRLKYINNDFLGIGNDPFISFLSQQENRKYAEDGTCQIINEDLTSRYNHFAEIYDGLINMSCSDKWISRGIYRNFFSDFIMGLPKEDSKDIIIPDTTIVSESDISTDPKISPYRNKFRTKLHDKCSSFSSFVSGNSYSENRSLATITIHFNIQESELP
jgi:uncharacterized protein YjbI with pentapeptide repeats